MFGMIGQDTNWRVQKNNYTKKIKVAFKVVQIKFNAYYQSKIKFYIFTSDAPIMIFRGRFRYRFFLSKLADSDSDSDFFSFKQPTRNNERF